MSDITFPNMEILRQRVDYQGLILGLICAVVTLLLMIGQKYTAEPIKERLAEDRLAVLSQVLPEGIYDNDPLADVVFISDTPLSKKELEVYVAKKLGSITGFAFQIETEGYGGTITLMVGLNTDGEILGLRTLSHKETPGLADKIEIDKSDWITVFSGESLKKTEAKQWAVKKDGGKFDQFTGATITPRAIVRAVFTGLQFYANRKEEFLMSEKIEEVSKGEENESR